MKIREYIDSDFDLLVGWWNSFKEVPPTKDLMPESSFILEVDSIPRVSISLILTNTKYSYLENLISNPEISADKRNIAVKTIVSYAEEYAKSLGYKYLVCFSYKDKLKARYQQLGYLRTVDNLSSFVKEI